MMQYSLKTLNKLDKVKKKEKRKTAKQKKAEYNKLYIVNLTGSGKGLDLGGPFSDFSLLLQ